MHKFYCYTYIVASRSRTLYIGMTRDIEARVFQHKCRLHEGFSAKYNCNRLVWYERFVLPDAAIAREKQLKGWVRAKKIALIEKTNPTWVDLSEQWFSPGRIQEVSVWRLVWRCFVRDSGLFGRADELTLVSYGLQYRSFDCAGRKVRDPLRSG
jgi:putative endonuclease